jgi:hypothetical protein
MNKGRVGEERRGKEMDGCPLTLPPLQKCGVTTCEDCQEVARSALVKGIESKMAAQYGTLHRGICSGTVLSSALHVLVYAPPIDCDSCHNHST